MAAVPPENMLARVLAHDHDADATSARILDAALAQFAEFGLRRTSMEDVARRAGVARITVYRRFAAKNALVEAVLLREVRRFLEVFTAAVDGLPDVADRVAEGFVVTLRHARGHGLFQRLMATEPDALLPFLTVDSGPFLAAARTFLAGVLRGADGVAPDVAEDADVTAETLIRIVLSFVLAPDGRVPLDDDERARRYARRHLAPMITRRPPAGP
ncbi:TetR/AcrR family transcriptional regulator [Actinomadura sp. NTSP31]|uniref:TetR/AcrR family transcriptional regulator n=1 Tax=Actinomadura sp. NTSP31 TaxID=1735447 RepID=UPI0035C14032